MSLASVLQIETFCLESFTQLTTSQLEEILIWRNTDSVRDWMYNSQPITLSDHLEFVQGLKGTNNHYYLVKDQQNAKLGVLSFKLLPNNQSAYFGMYANPHENQLGLGFKFDKIAQSICFELLNYKTLKLEIFEQNVSVIEIHKRMGFKIEGTLKNFARYQGQWENVLIMGITLETYLALISTKQVKSEPS
ncbi:MAG: UDP-4-amino-4,6-dideoxy-N-acetyl-beta-L-altrosamine N-acetyltransferase [Candidatus Margulisiibacteriota bacterium]